MIYKCVPEKHRKLIVHVHKTTQRLKRQYKAKKTEKMVCVPFDIKNDRNDMKCSFNFLRKSITQIEKIIQSSFAIFFYLTFFFG